jgi:hypothetical protein
MRRALLHFVVLAACTDDGGGGGPGVTTHVESFQFASSMMGRCFDGMPADLDPDLAGAQYDCSISETIAGVETIFPQCNVLEPPASSTNKPCWVIRADATTCPGSGLTLRIIRDGAAPDGLVNGQCSVQ